jgi:Protein of unknown function (DUF3987)
MSSTEFVQRADYSDVGDTSARACSDADRARAGHSEAPNTPWPKLEPEAFHGIVGDVVRTVGPHSEADPVALVMQLLTSAGNLIGPLPYYQVEAHQHHANLFCVLVGASSKARKGTSLGRIRAVLKDTDEAWNTDRIKSGLSSGEGLINEVRDEVRKWDVKNATWETVDPGVADKRLMVVEEEFAGALAVAERPGNTLSPNIRKAWDGEKLATMTKNSPLCATGAHISIIGHITEDELRARLTRTDIANGFANRFLFALVKRSKYLPFGGALSDQDIAQLSHKLNEVLGKVRSLGRINLDHAARTKWQVAYRALSAEQPGLLGSIVARAEAQTMRLALVYALLDGKREICEPHLRAALAVWEYCEASAAHIFGNLLGDPTADEIQRALEQAASKGMSRTEIRDLFGRNRSADRIGAALALLRDKGRARMEEAEPGANGGRATERWFTRKEATNG